MATDARTALVCPETSIHRYQDLLRATTAIAGCRDIRTFRERFASELQRFISFDYALVNILDSKTQAVLWRMFDAPGRNHEVDLPDFQSHDTPTGWVYANQKPFIVDERKGETRFPKLREFLLKFDIRSSCVLPLAELRSNSSSLAT